jgi:hypothetical protein
MTDSARGVTLWFIVGGALLYGIVNTLAKVVYLLA